MDDEVIIAEDEEAKYIFRKLKDTYDVRGLKTNTSKTEHVTTSLNADESLDDINIKTVEEF